MKTVLRLPDRLDERRYRRGIIWRRNREHETKVLQAKAQILDLSE